MDSSEVDQMSLNLETVDATNAPSGDATDASDLPRGRSRSRSVTADYLRGNTPIDHSAVKRDPDRSPSPAPNYRV